MSHHSCLVSILAISYSLFESFFFCVHVTSSHRFIVFYSFFFVYNPLCSFPFKSPNLLILNGWRYQKLRKVKLMKSTRFLPFRSWRFLLFIKVIYILFTQNLPIISATCWFLFLVNYFFYLFQLLWCVACCRSSVWTHGSGAIYVFLDDQLMP